LFGMASISPAALAVRAFLL